MPILFIFLIFIVFIIFTLPIAFSMELATVISLLTQGNSNAMISILTKMFTGANATSFLAIPFFILAGALMEQGGISDRILKFASGLVGHLRGGLA